MGIKPNGTEGKDWAAQRVLLKNGAEVQITATNTTINAVQHNASRVVLKIND